jgi:fluoride exporter
MVVQFLWVGLGSALGGMARFGLNEWISSRVGSPMPWGTIMINVSGSFLIGLLAGLTQASGQPALPPVARHLALVGFLGGYTTFSAFSLQTLNLAREGRWNLAAGNVGLSVVASLAAVALGAGAARSLRS